MGLLSLLLCLNHLLLSSGNPIHEVQGVVAALSQSSQNQAMFFLSWHSFAVVTDGMGDTIKTTSTGTSALQTL